MKKFITLILAITLAFVSVVPAFAVEDGFVSSPSREDDLYLEGWANESIDCAAELVLTLFKDRTKLSDYLRAMLEKAYEIIVNCEDITTLCDAFAKYVASLGLTGKDLAVTEVFDLSYYNCDTHDDHGYFTIKLGSKALKNFVGLLHYNDGVWEFIDNARVLPDGETLEFKAKDFSPFAIVVDTSDKVPGDDIPNTDVQVPVVAWICAAVAFTSTVIITFVVKQKKVKE